MIASWQNAASAGEQARVEAAIRPAGSSAFLPSQVLPQLAQWWEPQLTAGGDQAVLAWIVGDTFDEPSRAPRAVVEAADNTVRVSRLHG